jgi:peroxiredoxin
VCAREAPGLEQFARDHQSDVTVIGLGTQGEYGEAQDFVARYGITFRMFWDESFKSWDGYDVWRQPTSILVSRGGTELKRWQSMMRDDERADAVRLARDQG